MNELTQLLSQADAGAPCPPPQRDLAARVRQIARRRSRIKATATGVVIALVAAASVKISIVRSHRQLAQIPLVTATAPIGSRRFQLEISGLETLAATHERIARQLIRTEVNARLDDERPLSDPLDQIAAQRNRAAWILVRDADLRIAQPGEKAGAIETYRSALRLFPDTPAAKDAARRLKNAGV